MHQSFVSLAHRGWDNRDKAGIMCQFLISWTLHRPCKAVEPWGFWFYAQTGRDNFTFTRWDNHMTYLDYFVLAFRQNRCPSLSCPLDSLPPGGQANNGKLAPGGQAVPGYLTPALVIFDPGGASCPGRFILPPAHTEKILLCDVYYYLQHFNNYMQFLSYKYVNLRWLLQIFSWVSYWQGVGVKLSRAVYLAPCPEFPKKLDNQQFLLHQLLQKYLAERDINFISVNLRCLHQIFSWVTYWQGVGGKLSRAVYLDPSPELQREWIIHKFYYTIYYRNI